MLLRVVVAIGMVIGALGPTTISCQLVQKVEQTIASPHILSRPSVDKTLSVLTALSPYYFHTDEELLAWRAIGIAARQALERSIHRKKILQDTSLDPEQGMWLIRTFWSIYVLDKRWSFGTSLPFVLHDSDIDPELPEPDSDTEYLKCMVKYGRLCSKLWAILPHFEKPNRTATAQSIDYLRFHIQSWTKSIPVPLRLYDGRDTFAPAVDCTQRRLQVLLYLRGNHLRILLSRRHVMGAEKIKSDVQAAVNVVELACDTVRVLVGLSKDGEIFLRQQVAFNYFLVTSLALIFLSVCHSPEIFAVRCRPAFDDAIKLVRLLSERSHVGKRLWKSIRKLLPQAKRLGLGEGTVPAPLHNRNGHNTAAPELFHVANELSSTTTHLPTLASHADNWQTQDQASIDNTLVSDPLRVPDVTNITDDLSQWYSFFGSEEYRDGQSTEMFGVTHPQEGPSIEETLFQELMFV